MNILITLIVLIVLCFLISGYYSFTPERRQTTGAFLPVYSSRAPLSPVVYEGFFPYQDEVRKLFEQLHSKAVDTPSIIRQDLGGEEMARILLHYDI